MIAYLQGKIIDISNTSLVLLTESGVGYELGIHEWLFQKFATLEEADLHVYHHITESTQSLFAFATLEEKKVFIELIKISWVGWKVAMLLLSLGIDTLLSAIQLSDTKVKESVKGIGKKMAEKIVLEMKDKDIIALHWTVAVVSQWGEQITLEKGVVENIKGTLQNMGYSSRDIERVLATVPSDLQGVEEILPYVIRELS